MRIRDHFKRASLAISTAILIASTLMLLMYWRWVAADKSETWAHEVVRLTFQCHVLATEVLKEVNSRAVKQYDLSSGHLSELLRVPPKSFATNKSVDDIVREKRLIDDLLRRARETAVNGALARERQSMLQGQIGDR